MKSLFGWLTLKNLKIGQKLMVVVLPFLLPIGVLSWIMVQRSGADAGAARKELDGVEYARPIRALLRDVVRCRALAAKTLNGAGSARGDLEAAAAQADVDAAAADVLDQKRGAALHTTEKWQAIRGRWQALQVGVFAMKPEASRDEHARLMADITALLSDVRESSGLLLDPEPGPHFLQEALLSSLPHEMEEADRLHALADISAEDRAQFEASAARSASAAGDLDRDLAGAIRGCPGLEGRLGGPRQQQRAGAQAFLDSVEARLLKANPTPRPAGEFSEAASRAAEADFALADAVDSELTGLLTARIDGVYRTTTWALSGIVGGLALVVCGAYLATRTITRQVHDIRDLFARISVGELQARASVLSNDELGRMAASLNAMLDNTVALIQSREQRDAIQEAIRKLLREIGGVAEGDLTQDAVVTTDVTGPIADSFNFMIRELRRIIGNVKQATQQVGAASDQIQSSAGRLARGTEVQTQRIAETFRSVEAMAKSAQDVAHAADRGADVAGQALAGAKRGAAAVGETMTFMQRIRERVQETSGGIRRLGESSQQIGEIVRLIDDIADRTSILALNASIQAAAAGEAGRGFAVVADEVERLAERSATATRRIAGLVQATRAETGAAIAGMEDCTREVVEGSRVAQQAGQALAQIDAVSQTLATVIQSISEEARRQAAASQGVTRAMGEMSEITQQTAAGASEGAAAVNRLAQLADDLRESVSAFRLPDADAPAVPVAPSRIAADLDAGLAPATV